MFNVQHILEFYCITCLRQNVVGRFNLLLISRTEAVWYLKQSIVSDILHIRFLWIYKF